MHEMDWTRVDHRCLDLSLRELIRQMDERFVTREEFEEHSKWLLSQQTAAWDRMMDHSHGARGELVFPRHPSCPPATEPITVCDSEVGCVTFQEHWVVDTVTATQRGCKCPLCYSVVQPRAKCKCVDDYWITDICEYHGYPSFCCYCGNPLKEKFEKGKNEALSALDSERNEHAREVEDIKFRCTWLHSDLEQQVADLRKRIAELEAQLQDEQP